jgi:hypothetical protein
MDREHPVSAEDRAADAGSDWSLHRGRLPVGMTREQILAAAGPPRRKRAGASA